MAIELRHTQQVKQTQQLRMTLELRQALEMLAMTNLELKAYIEQQLQENPMLELDEQFGQPLNESTAQDELASKPKNEEQRQYEEARKRIDDLDIDNVYADRDHQYGALSDHPPSALDFQAQPVGLADYLISQIGERRLSEEVANLAKDLVYCLNEDGYLSADELSDICSSSDLPEEVFDEALSVLQSLEPRGVGARDLGECLLIQLEGEDEDDVELIRDILSHHLSDLEKSNYEVIARALKVSVDDVIEAHRTIQTLNPRPAIDFGGSPADYIIPDVQIVRQGDLWVPLLNDQSLPSLHLNEEYLRIARKRGRDDDKSYLRKHLRDAQELFRAISKRRETIIMVVAAIIEEQSDFFTEGARGLKPLILQDIAEKVDLSESTISRATKDKYVQTPRGVFPLRMFFSASLKKSDSGEEIAADSIKPIIRELIEQEPAEKPYSDQRISDILRNEHKVDIARRTVSKYREQLGILPSSRRKRRL